MEAQPSARSATYQRIAAPACLARIIPCHGSEIDARSRPCTAQAMIRADDDRGMTVRQSAVSSRPNSSDMPHPKPRPESILCALVQLKTPCELTRSALPQLADDTLRMHRLTDPHCIDHAE